MLRIKFRDIFAVIIIIGILLIWALQAANILGSIPGDVNGVLTAAFILIVQFYFRKRPQGESG